MLCCKLIQFGEHDCNNTGFSVLLFAFITLHEFIHSFICNIVLTVNSYIKLWWRICHFFIKVNPTPICLYHGNMAVIEAGIVEAPEKHGDLKYINLTIPCVSIIL